MNKVPRISLKKKRITIEIYKMQCIYIFIPINVILVFEWAAMLFFFQTVKTKQSLNF